MKADTMFSHCQLFFQFLALLILHCVTLNCAHADSRPNIVLFLVDDMGVMDSSVPFLTDEKGQPQIHPLNEFYKTPHIEHMAAQGIRFSQFYAQSVCSPTRVSIVTGQNSARHHTTNWINPTTNNRGKYGPQDWNWKGLTSSSITLPRLLSQAGYKTLHVGKGHFGPQAEPGSNPQIIGFDFNIGGTGAGQPSSYFGLDNYGNSKNARKKDHAVPHLDKYHGTETYLTEALTLEAKSKLSDFVAEKKPFFLYMAHYAVHSPFMADSRFVDIYAEAKQSPQAKTFGSMISGIDKSLGDLVDHLHNLGVAENTLVFFLGDNGTDAPFGPTHDVACAAPLRGKKGTHYEGGMRVPFIAAWAKNNQLHPLQRKYPIKPAATQTQVASILDLMPTILEVTAINTPPEHPLDGKSLCPLFNGGKSASQEESFLMHFPHEHRSSYFTSFRLGDWKLIYHYYPEKSISNTRYELYHLVNDPYESHNLANSNPTVLKNMTLEMTARLKFQHAQFPVADDGITALIPVIPE